MRRRLRQFILGLLVVLLIAGAAGVWAVRTGLLDRWLANRLRQSAADYNARLEIDSLHLTLRSLTLELGGVKLTTLDSRERLFTAESLRAELKLVSFFRQRVSLERLDLLNPVITIRRNPAGEWNLAALKWPKTEPNEKPRVELASSVFRLTGGTMVYEDAAYNLGGEFSNLTVRVEPAEQSQRVHVGFAGSELSVGNKRFDRLSFEADGTFNGTHASAERITIQSPSWKANLNGRVLDWKPLRYELHADADMNVAPLGKTLAPELGIAGEVTFKGSVSGEGSKYQAQGDLTSNNFSMRALRAERLSLAQSGGGEGFRYRFAGQLNIGTLLFDRVRFDAFRSPVKFDGVFAELPSLSATALGGEIHGSARVSIEPGGEPSSADLTLQHLNLAQLSSLALAESLPLDGTADVTAKLQWRGFSIDTLTGTVGASANGSARADKDKSPVPFQCVARVHPHGRGAQIESFRLEGANTVASVAGTVDRNGILSLEVSASMQNLQTTERLLREYGLISPTLLGGDLGLGGAGSFRGKVEGKAATPEISGQFDAGQISLHQEIAGRLRGQVHYQAGELRLRSASLERPDGSSAQLDLLWPIGHENSVSLDARLKRLDLGFLLRAAGPGFSERVGAARGKLDGEMRLTGLPGIHTVRGEMDVRLSGGEFRGERFAEVAGKFTLDASRLKLNNVRLDLASGKFQIDGFFNLSSFDYDLKASAREFNVSRLFASEDGSSPVKGFVNIDFQGSGNYEAPSFDCTITSDAISVKGEPFTKLHASGKSNKGIAQFNAAAEYFGSRHVINGTLDARDPGRYRLTAEETLSKAPVRPYLSFIPGLPPGIAGTMSGKLEYSGELQDSSTSQLRFELSAFAPTIQIEGLGEGYALQNEGPVVLSVGSRQIDFQSFRLRGEGTNVEARGALALSNAGSNTLKIGGEINLQLFTLALSRGTSRSFFSRGTARLEASVSGQGIDGRLNGTAEVSGMSLRWLDLPLSIENGRGRILFTANQAELDGFKATAGGGTVSISGGFILKNLLPDRWRYQMRAEQVRLNWPSGVRSILDGDLTLQGNNKIQVLGGAITVRRAEYISNVELADLLLASRNTTFNPADVNFATPLTLDLRVDARDSLIVRNNFADAVGSASLRIRGPVNKPLLSGRLTVTRGTIDFRAQRYIVTRGLADLPDRPGAEPYFNIEAESDIRGYRVILTYIGTLSKFTLEPRSEPALPSADVVALITTGNILPDTADRTQFQSQANVGAASSLLSETLTRGIERQTDRLFGLNRFQLDPLLVGRGTDPTARVTVGRRVTKDLTITYSTNVSSTEEQVILVEFRLSDRISLVGLRDERGKFGFDVRFRKRF